MTKNDSGHYEETIFLKACKGEFDTEKIVQYVSKNIPLSFVDPNRTNTWLICYSSDDRSYAEKYCADADRSSLPGVPIMGLSGSCIVVCPGYDDEDNVRLRDVLNWLLKERQIEIRNECNKKLALDFSSFPLMTYAW